MYAGVPGVTGGGGERLPGARACHRLHQTEVEHLDEIAAQSESAHLNVGRFDVAVHQAAHVRFFEGLADLAQNVDHPGGRHRAVLTHQRLEIHAVQQLHHEVERVLFRYPAVVQLDSVGRPQAGHHVGLAPETLDGQLRRFTVVRTDHLGPDQLDRSRPCEQPMRRPVHLPHSPAPRLA
jgi:hypothetical protein